MGRPRLRTRHTLTELRYFQRDMTRAERGGHRPVPTPVVRSFTAYRYPRATNARLSSPYESTARADLRLFRTAALKHLRAAPSGTLLAAAEELDHPPTRHRHRDLWEA
jgi:hypothetical protein